MRVFFALVGILFDLILLAAAAAAIYCVFRPELLADVSAEAQEFIEDPLGRWEVFAGALALLALSLRGVFLLLFGRGERAMEVSRGRAGAVTVSRSTFDRAVEALLRERAPGGRLMGCRVRRRGGKLEMAVRLRVNVLEVPLGEFAAGLQDAVIGHFRDFLGIEVGRVDVVVEGAMEKRTGVEQA